MADENKTRMGGAQKGGLQKKSLGDTGLPKPQANPSLKPVTQKGIMGKSGSLGGTMNGISGSDTRMTPVKGTHSLKGFSSGGKVQP